jgi:hypothetical protein
MQKIFSHTFLNPIMLKKFETFVKYESYFVKENAEENNEPDGET